MAKENNILVELDELLAAEFNYIAQTAAQANEDRARVSSFYLIAVGSLLAALFGTQLFDPDQVTPTVKFMFSGLFAMLTLLGTSTVMQLAQLRAAWYESVRAMNQLKDFAMKQNPQLVDAFRWKTGTIPAKYKRGSVSYYQALEVSLIGGVVFGAAVFFLLQALHLSNLLTWLLCIPAGGGAIFIQMSLYKRLLK
jgi:hypothetical protein